jgi:hypothetical protein
MENNLTSLFSYQVKIQALIQAAIIVVLDKVIYLAGGVYINSRFYHIFFNYLVVLALLTAVNSKNKIDDERSMFVRYSILKSTFGLFVVLFGIIALLSDMLEIDSLSMLTILYCIESLLVFHLIAVFLANKYNPAWLFKENTAPKNYNQMMIGLFYGFYFILLILIVMSFLKN